MTPGGGGSAAGADWLLAQTQEKMGQQFERELIAQLRTQYGYEITDADEAKKIDDMVER